MLGGSFENLFLLLYLSHNGNDKSRTNNGVNIPLQSAIISRQTRDSAPNFLTGLYKGTKGHYNSEGHEFEYDVITRLYKGTKGHYNSEDHEMNMILLSIPVPCPCALFRFFVGV